MSPKIGTTVGLAPFAQAAEAATPIDLVRAAVRICEAQGIRVGAAASIGHNVGRHEITRGWVVDGPRRVISLAGAVCVALQPLDGEEVEDAAAIALEASWPWLCGLWDGWEGDAQTTMLTGMARPLYLDGVRAGHLLFGEMTVACARCGLRRFTADAVCGNCG